MTRNNSFLLLFLLTPFLVFSQDRSRVVMPSSDEELIMWSSDKKLAWSDYKGEPDPQSDAAASTTTLLTVSYHFTKNGFTYSIGSEFDPSRSWGTHRTPYILSHEQGHFDIAEIFARKLNKELQEYVFDKRTYQKDLRKIYNRVTEEKEKMQNDYDEETRHSILRARQAEWLKKIADMLEEYSDYANYR
jgi:hypothetical protein